MANFFIIGLALSIWIFFYVWSEPLNTNDTIIVVAICAVIVLSGKWILFRTWRRKGYVKKDEGGR